MDPNQTIPQTSNPTNTIPPVSPSPLPSSSFIKNKKMFIFLGIFLLLLSLLGTSFFLGAYNSSSKNPSNPPILPSLNNSSTVSASPTTIAQTINVIKLADAWSLGTKTYTNPKIEITFDYPSYFETSETDIAKSNAYWAEKYKNDASVKQPLYRSSFYVTFNSHNPEEAVSQEICENKMDVSVQEYTNSQGMSLYNFIADLNKSYPGNGITESFETYKKNLTQSQLPKTGSYTFEGIIGENPEKEVYFMNKNNVYVFSLRGNCDTGGQYSPDAEVIFDNILKSVNFL